MLAGIDERIERTATLIFTRMDKLEKLVAEMHTDMAALQKLVLTSSLTGLL